MNLPGPPDGPKKKKKKRPKPAADSSPPAEAPAPPRPVLRGLPSIAATATVKAAIAGALVPEPVPAGSKLVLGLDLGTNLGMTIGFVKLPMSPDARPHQVHVTQASLKAGSYESGAIRFVRLRNLLTVMAPAAVFFEEPKTTPAGSFGNNHAVIARYATAAELLGAFKATVVAWCEEHGVPCAGLAIGSIKRFATGRGSASKEDMIRACNDQLGLDLEVDGYQTEGTDNMADSYFALMLGLAENGAGL